MKPAFFCSFFVFLNFESWTSDYPFLKVKLLQSNEASILLILYTWYVWTGTLPRSESKNLTTATFQSGQEEAISSIDHHFLENDNANNGDLVQNGFHRCPDPDVNQISGRHLLK